MEGPPRQATFCDKIIKGVTDVRTVVLFTFVLSVALVCAAVFFSEHIGNTENSPKDCDLPHQFRIDCLPGTPRQKVDKGTCERRQCCFKPIDKFTFGDIPSCYHFHPTPYKYVYDGNINAHLQPNLNTTSANLKLQQHIKVVKRYVTKTTARILLGPEEEIKKQDQILEYLRYSKQTDVTEKDADYDITINDKDNLFIKIFRKDKTNIFSTEFGPLIFSEDYIQISILLPSRNIYGLGQGHHPTFRHNLQNTKVLPLVSRYGTWNGPREQADLSDYNSSSSVWPGVHPFYLVIENNGNAHGVLLLNSYPMEVTLTSLPSITFRSVGGAFDFFIFLGPHPSDVIRQLTDLVGRPAMPPYWALGYHTCRRMNEIYETTKILSDIEMIRNKYIPHESDCGNDIMMGLDPVLTSTTEFETTLHNNNQKFISVTLPQANSKKITFTPVYGPVDKKVYIGEVDGKEVAYPDFFSENKQWTEEYAKLIKTAHIDGVILDRNTPADFRSGSHCRNNEINDPKFAPGGKYLSDGTVCMDAVHENSHSHQELHNMYGFRHMMKTHEAFEKRPFLSSLSTFTGSGKYGGHWGGEYHSTWEMLKQSVVQMLEFGMYGIPLTGAPTCGFSGEFNQDLCSRWIQVAAFQPLMMTYRNDSTFVVLSDERIISVARNMLRLRYSLLPYLYTLFYLAFMNGDMVIRPLAFEFPDDPKSLSIDDQFLWGSSLLVSPALRNNTKFVKAYFPPGCWYNIFTGRPDSSSTKEGQFLNLETLSYQINLHMRGGYVIPWQENGDARTTFESRKRNLKLTIALSCSEKNQTASGKLFIDDGESVIGNSNFLLVTIYATNRNITLTPSSSTTNSRNFPSTILDTVDIFGLQERPSKINVNNKEYTNWNSELYRTTLKHLSWNLEQKLTIVWTPA